MMGFSPDFPVIDQLREAADRPNRDAAMARLLLRCSDEIVLHYADALADACAALTFPSGADYLRARRLVLSAVRTPEGELAWERAAELECCRQALLARVRA